MPFLGGQIGEMDQGGFGAGAGEFTPLEIPSLVLWLDASTVTGSGGVAVWSDLSGNGNDATQGTTANQPQTGTRTENGLNVLDFDGSNDYMILPSALYTLSDGNNTIVTIFRTDSTITDQRLVSGSDDGANSRVMQRLNSGSSIQLRNTSGGSTVSLSTSYDTTNVHILVQRRSGSTLQGYYDGSTVTGSGVAQNVGGISSFILGSQPGASGSFLEGAYCEQYMFDDDISDAKLNQLGNYLSDKWGATWLDI